MHSLLSKCTEMCSLFENALLYLLNVSLHHSLTNCIHVYSDAGGVISRFYTFNTQVCSTQRVKMCSLNKSWGEPCIVQLCFHCGCTDECQDRCSGQKLIYFCSENKQLDYGSRLWSEIKLHILRIFEWFFYYIRCEKTEIIVISKSI